MEAVDLNMVHKIKIANVSTDLKGKKMVYIKFSLGNSRYQLMIMKTENDWIPKHVYHSSDCPFCAIKRLQCKAFDQCKNELFKIIKSSIRLQLLFI